MKLKNGKAETPPVWNGGFDLSDLDDLSDWLANIKLGGMTQLVKDILNQAFGSCFPSASIAKRSDMNYQRGILLYGPPGTGKTYLARKLCELLNSKEPKIVNRPELRNMYLGDTERKLREVFEDAVQDYKIHGNNSKLHVVILDELDSFAPLRSKVETSNWGNESALSSLLVVLDGLACINNIFIICTTNKRELIDEALLREGRIGLTYELGYPDENSRYDMLRVILRNWDDDGRLDNDVDIHELGNCLKCTTIVLI